MKDILRGSENIMKTIKRSKIPGNAVPCFRCNGSKRDASKA